MQYYLIHLKSNNENDEHLKCLTMLGNYLCTLTLLHDRPFSSYRSSLIAASCLFYANRLLANDRDIQITSYREQDLRECTRVIEDIFHKTFHQDATTSSVLRRYLKPSKDNEKHQSRMKDLIHHSSKFPADDDDDEVLDLTLDEFDQENMSMEHQR